MLRFYHQYLLIISSPQTCSIGFPPFRKGFPPFFKGGQGGFPGGICKSRFFRWIWQSNGSICGVLIIIIFSLVGCIGSSKMVPEVSTTTVTRKDNYVYNDEKTGEIAGACLLAILKPLNPDDAFNKEQLGLRYLIKIINNTTKIKAKIESTLPATAITTSSPFLLVKPSDALRIPSVLEQLEKYVNQGGFVMIDGSWGGRIIKKGTRTQIVGEDEILLFPFNLGKPSPHQLEAIVVDGRIAILITNRNYGHQWAVYHERGRKTTEGVFSVKLGINAVVYALTHSKLSDISRFSLKRTPQAQSNPGILKKPPGMPPI